MTTGSVTIETTLRRDYRDETDEASLRETTSRDVVMSRDLEDIEDAVWCLEAREWEVVKSVWDHFRDTEEFEEWGYNGPYPNGDISVSPSYGIDKWHGVVNHIADREETDPVGVYIDLMIHPRIDQGDHNIAMRRYLAEYLATEGYDSSYWTHGYSPK